MASQGQFPKEDGSVLFSTDVNVSKLSLRQLYTGSQMNISNGKANTSSTGSAVFNFIGSEWFGGGSYLKISINGAVSTKTIDVSQTMNNATSSVSASLLTTYSGGTLTSNSSITLQYLNTNSNLSNLFLDVETANNKTSTMYYAIGSVDRVSGLYAMISISGTNSGSASHSFTNTWTELTII